MVLMGLIGAVVHKQMRVSQNHRAASGFMGAWELVPPLRDPSFRRSDIELPSLNKLERPPPVAPKKRAPPPKRPPLPA